MLLATVIGEFLPPHVALYTIMISYVDWKLKVLHRGPLGYYMRGRHLHICSLCHVCLCGCDMYSYVAGGHTVFQSFRIQKVS